MKIVHTADWHVGKSLRGKHRGVEYRQALEQIANFIEKEAVDLVLVAGDLFDSVAPSAEAEEIVYQFFRQVSEAGARVVVIAGNHDSPLRFKAISYLLSLARVHVLGTPLAPDQGAVITLPDRTCEEYATIGMLPFVPERLFVRAEEILGLPATGAQRYAEQMAAYLGLFAAHCNPRHINILVAHLLIHGARPGTGERRLYLGDHYAVKPTALPNSLQYVALGHIHRQQHIPAPVPAYYCGSILQLDFGEAEQAKGFLYLETHPGEPACPTFVPLNVGKRLVEIRGTLDEIRTLLQADPGLREAYLRVTIRSDTASVGLAYQLRQEFPGALEIRREKSLAPSTSPPDLSRSPVDLYRDYYLKTHGHPPTTALLQEFRRFYEEENESNDLA